MIQHIGKSDEPLSTHIGKKVMNLSLLKLRYFVTTAEEGSITAAAQRLHISQPSISAAISQLEDSLKLPLFIRKSSSGLILTPGGQQILSKARALLAHADEFQTTASTLNSEVSGRIRVACFVNLAPIHFASLLAKFKEKFPYIEVDFYDRDQSEIFDGIRNAKYELALTFDLGEPNEFDEFKVIFVAKIPPHAILAKNHRLAKQQSVSLKELSPEPLILMDLPHSREYLLSLFSFLKLHPNLKYLPRSFEMVRALAGNGLGYGLLGLVPKTTSTYDGSQVVSLPLKESVRYLNMIVIQLKQMPTRQVVETFTLFIKNHFKEYTSP